MMLIQTKVGYGYNDFEQKWVMIKMISTKSGSHNGLKEHMSADKDTWREAACYD